MVADYAWRIGRNQLVRANHGGQKTQKTHVALIPYLRPYKSCCSCKAAVRFAHGHAIGDDTESPLCHCERATKKIDNFLGLFGPLTLISPPNSASPYLCFSTSVWPVARRFLVLMVLSIRIWHLLSVERADFAMATRSEGSQKGFIFGPLPQTQSVRPSSSFCLCAVD